MQPYARPATRHDPDHLPIGAVRGRFDDVTPPRLARELNVESSAGLAHQRCEPMRAPAWIGVALAQGANDLLSGLNESLGQRCVQRCHLCADLILKGQQLIDRGRRIAAVDGSNRCRQRRPQRCRA